MLLILSKNILRVYNKQLRTKSLFIIIICIDVFFNYVSEDIIFSKLHKMY